MTHPTTASLFDDDEGNRQPVSVVAALQQSKPVTKAQQQFRRLVAKIELKRQQLQQWQTYEVRYSRRIANELQPLHAQIHAGQRQMVLLLDEVLSNTAPGRRLGRVQRAKLKQILMTLITDLLEVGDDAALEALHDKYSDVSRDDIRQSQLELTQDMLQDVFGLDIDDDLEAESAEELLERAEQRMREQAGADASKRSRARSAKADAARAKRDQAAREVGQSLREIYRKLVSALHPDREPDSEARQRKTLMMQRVNQAYEANDLLALLGLQLEIEQIDAKHLSSVSPDRLTHYNQILREQLADLEAEIERCLYPFRTSTDQWGVLTPDYVDRRLSADIAELKQGLRSLEQDLVAFRDPKVLLDSIKHYQLEQEDDDDTEALLELMEMMQSLQPARGPHGKTRRHR